MTSVIADNGDRGRGTGERGERSLLKKLRKTFMKKGDMDIVCASPIAHQYCSVQRIWTSPNAAGDRSGAAHAVILRLFDLGADIRVEMRGERGMCDSIFVGWTSMGKNFPSQNYTFSIPQRGILPLQTKLYPAIAPCKRHILPPTIHEWTQSLPVEGGSHREPLANDLLMYWTEQYWCAIGLAQTPPIPSPS